MSRRNRKSVPSEPVEAYIESITHDARGVARIDGKTVFVDGALPGERVMFRYRLQRKNYDEAETVEILEASPQRVTPGCPHFGVCGGCSLQHMQASEQIVAKENVLRDNFRQLAQVEPKSWLPPLMGPHWGYRHKARLSARFVEKKGGALVGFRERRSSYLAVMESCPVLHPNVGERITDLRNLIGSLEAKSSIPQIEIAVAENETVLIFRNLEPLSKSDEQALIAFGQERDLHIYLQPKGPDSIYAIWPEQEKAESNPLYYSLEDYGLKLHFRATDFTQVNTDINRSMIKQALELLAPGPEDRILDLFCGLGNFTLPIATQAGEVIGVEGDEQLVQRARENAQANGIENAHFYAADLTAPPDEQPWYGKGFNKVLIDPPRTGAMEIIQRLKTVDADRIVYVSCNPATLARDSAHLVHELGYKLLKAGVMDMFPHTAHVESIALFQKRGA